MFAAIAVSELEYHRALSRMNKAAYKVFLESIAHLPEFEKKQIIEKRKQEETEERRHKETLQAIRDAKPSTPSCNSSFAGLFGFILGASIFHD